MGSVQYYAATLNTENPGLEDWARWAVVDVAVGEAIATERPVIEAEAELAACNRENRVQLLSALLVPVAVLLGFLPSLLRKTAPTLWPRTCDSVPPKATLQPLTGSRSSVAPPTSEVISVPLEAQAV